MSSMRIANTGKDSTSCTHVSSPSHHAASFGGRRRALEVGSSAGAMPSDHMRPKQRGVVGSLAAAAILIYGAACDPVTGTGPGAPPDPAKYLRSDVAAHTVVITLIAGYPATDFQFNYNGYGNGSLIITIPVGWHATVQCENRGTVPNSCAVVAGKRDVKPVVDGWSTPDPVRGLDPGKSATFEFEPSNQAATGSRRWSEAMKRAGCGRTSRSLRAAGRP